MCTIVGSTNLLSSVIAFKRHSYAVTKIAVLASLNDATESTAARSRYKQRTLSIGRRKWLPPDDKTFLFTFIVLVYLIAALIHFFQVGDGSMLSTLLECVGAYVGIKTITKRISS